VIAIPAAAESLPINAKLQKSQKSIDDWRVFHSRHGIGIDQDWAIWDFY
jgi:hypothetical protein